MRCFYFAAGLMLLFVPVGSAVAAPGSAVEILQVSGVSNGVFVQLEFTSPALIMRLAQSGHFLAHGFSSRRETVVAARVALLSAGLSGLATVERGSPKCIAFADRLVSLLVAEDADALLRNGLTASEIGRVLAPEGVVCLGVSPKGVEGAGAVLRQAGLTDVRAMKLSRTWVVGRLKRPTGMDDWTHPYHGPDGNAVSQDQLIGPPNVIRWCTGPTIPTTRPDKGLAYSGVIRMASLKGRNFYLLASNNLVARDGFNGLLLWTEPVGPEYPVHTRLVVAGDRLCVSGDKKIRLMDPVSGEVIRSIPGDPWVMVGVTNRLITLDQRTVNCFDLDTGALKWATTNRFNRPDSCPPVAGNGCLYMLRDRELTATVIESGKLLWKRDTTNDLGAGARMSFVHDDLLLCRKTKGTTNLFFSISARSGTLKWTFRAVKLKKTAYPGDQPFYVKDRVWVNDWDEKGAMLWKALNPADGSVEKTLKSPIGGIGCHPMFVTDRYAIGRRPSHFMSWEDGQMYTNSGARGACGLAPFLFANGQFNLQQCNVPFGCVCGSFFAGVSGWAEDPTNAVPDDGQRWEKGEVVPAVAGGVGAADWPMFRCDARRSSFTSNTVPAVLQVLWTRKLEPGKWPDSLIRHDWLTRVPSGHLLTGPTLADGKVFVSLTEAGAAVALDEKDGKRLWSFPTGGRLDTPPTFFDGLCMLGSHDGSVYALDAGSGRMAWRFRAAPTPRKIVAYGQVESSWPVVGGVLVASNLACVVAGRTTEMDGGLFLYGLNPKSGTLTWTAQWPLPPGKRVPPYGFIHRGPADPLVCDGPMVSIAAHVGGRLHLATGEAPKWAGFPTFGVPVKTGFNYVSRNLYGRGPGEYPPCPVAFTDVLSCEPAIQFGEGKKRVRHPLLRARVPGENKRNGKKPGKPIWEVPLAAGTVIESIVMAGETIVTAVSKEVEGKRVGELLQFSVKDGRPKGSLALPASPVYEGVAVGSRGRVYVSLEDGSVLCLGAAR